MDIETYSGTWLFTHPSTKHYLAKSLRDMKIIS